MQEAQGREINQTKWTRKIKSDSVDPLILGAVNEAAGSTAMLCRHDKAREEAIGVESEHRKEDKLVKFPQIPHRTHFGRQSIRKCYSGSKCEGTSSVEPLGLQRAREPALHYVV
ncbi:unnamed protein product [Thelazia callipaeda]|uniref:Uncharacterized protein n=1 Tax=Thelazia callipaeda TaxID=103827 RepID=A0A0N5D2X1_THECL|nr:unnamed protein product [Thelazia callipaeda]